MLEKLLEAYKVEYKKFFFAKSSGYKTVTTKNYLGKLVSLSLEQQEGAIKGLQNAIAIAITEETAPGRAWERIEAIEHEIKNSWWLDKK